MQPEPFIAAGVGLVIIVLVIEWHKRRARRILNNWAKENEYEVVSAHVRWFLRGPYSLFFTHKQIVLQFMVSDSNGATKTGWACCGHGNLGVIREMIDVQWDEDEQ